jgi:hypothetical protein
LSFHIGKTTKSADKHSRKKYSRRFP